MKSESSWFSHDGTTYTTSTVTIPASAFSAKKSGTYRLHAYVAASTGTYSGERYSADLGTVQILPNPATVQAGTSALTFEEQALRDIEATILAMEGNDITSYSVAGRSVTREERSRLFARRQILKAAVWRQQHPGKLGPSVETHFRQAQ